MYSPAFGCAGAVTRNRAESDSSSCAKLNAALAGDADHPAGSSSRTVACAAPFAPLVTDTEISRSTDLPPAAGTTTSPGVTRTDNAGTTFSSIRLSPAKTSLMYRNCTGTSRVTSTLPALIWNVTRNGVGANGTPNGTPWSKIWIACSPGCFQ